jgi:hypothetical protein
VSNLVDDLLANVKSLEKRIARLELSEAKIKKLFYGATEYLTVNNGSLVVNEASQDVDFRVEGNTNANMLVVDAGLDAVGIGGAAVAGVELTVTGDEVVTGFFGLGTPSTLTIATGAVTATKSYHLIDTEGGLATDDVDNINGGTDGSILFVRAANSARTVVCKDSTGNLRLAGDCTLDDAHDTLTLLNLSGTVWEELARSNNA